MATVMLSKIFTKDRELKLESISIDSGYATLNFSHNKAERVAKDIFFLGLWAQKEVLPDYLQFDSFGNLSLDVLREAISHPNWKIYPEQC